eukprot:s1597_g1.t3
MTYYLPSPSSPKGKMAWDMEGATGCRGGAAQAAMAADATDLRGHTTHESDDSPSPSASRPVSRTASERKKKAPKRRPAEPARPAKVALLVWKISCSLLSRAAKRTQRKALQEALGRLAAQHLVKKVLATVAQWERHALKNCNWRGEGDAKPAQTNLHLGVGWWELPELENYPVSVADATAAMLHAIQFGGSKARRCKARGEKKARFQHRDELRQAFEEQEEARGNFEERAKVIASTLVQKHADLKTFDTQLQNMCLPAPIDALHHLATQRDKNFDVHISNSKTICDGYLSLQNVHVYQALGRIYPRLLALEKELEETWLLLLLPCLRDRALVLGCEFGSFAAVDTIQSVTGLADPGAEPEAIEEEEGLEDIKKEEESPRARARRRKETMRRRKALLEQQRVNKGPGEASSGSKCIAGLASRPGQDVSRNSFFQAWAGVRSSTFNHPAGLRVVALEWRVEGAKLHSKEVSNSRPALRFEDKDLVSVAAHDKQLAALKEKFDRVLLEYDLVPDADKSRIAHLYTLANQGQQKLDQYQDCWGNSCCFGLCLASLMTGDMNAVHADGSDDVSDDGGDDDGPQNAAVEGVDDHDYLTTLTAVADLATMMRIQCLQDQLQKAEEDIEVLAHRTKEALRAESEKKCWEMLRKVHKKLARTSDAATRVMVSAFQVSEILGRSGYHASTVSQRCERLVSDRGDPATGTVLLGHLLHEVREGSKTKQPGAGTSRMRAVLFKAVADWLSVAPCSLHREEAAARGAAGVTWNSVQVDGDSYLVDIMFEPGALYEDGSGKACEYLRRLRQECEEAAAPSKSKTRKAESAAPSLQQNLGGRMLRPSWHVEPWEVEFDRRDRAGRGGFGEVFQGTWAGQQVAVKEVRDASPTDADVCDFVLEISLLSRLSHPNIVRFWRGCVDLRGGHRTLLLVTEWMDRGVLSQLLHESQEPTLTSGQSHVLALGIARGVAYLHHVKILHLDLKSPNAPWHSMYIKSRSQLPRFPSEMDTEVVELVRVCMGVKPGSRPAMTTTLLSKGRGRLSRHQIEVVPLADL